MWFLPRARFASLALVLVLSASAAVAQTVTQGDDMYLKMREVSHKLRCQCGGGCSYTVADCNMINCSFRESVNPEIRKALQAGLAPDVIVEQMIARFGSELRTEPLPEGFGLFGWAMPFAALALGFAVVPFVVKRWKQRQREADAARPPLDEQVVAQYEAAIERDLAQDE